MAKNALEEEKSRRLHNLCVDAFLGTGLVSVVHRRSDNPDDPEVNLTLGDYNPSRGIQHDLVKAMSTMMCRNLCFSASHPLIVAVDDSALDAATLSDDYNPARSARDTLRRTTFNGDARVVVLNGRQRVHAARQSFRMINDKVKRQKAHIDNLEEQANGFGGRVMTAAERRLRTSLDQAKEDLRHLEEMLEKIEFWPVQFYDIGLMEPLSKLSTADLFTGKLQSIPGTVQDFPEDRRDKDCLLRFLSENGPEPSQPKVPDERLAEILFHNLYTPQSNTSWSHLISDNRILESACHRQNLWEMMNAAMHVSPSLLGTSITSASTLHSNAQNNSLGVSFSFHLPKQQP